jgi:GMP synthase-like glutamine amidotransferase
MGAGMGKHMKKNILLVNCYREKAEGKIANYRGWLKAGAEVAGVDLDVCEVSEGEAHSAGGGFSAVVVSGSQKMVGSGEAEPGLLEFMNGCRRPLLGVCYGHQALARAFGCRVLKDGRKHLGDEEIFLNEANDLFAGFPPVFRMHESHDEIVARDPVLEEIFHVPARSASGGVEAIVHRLRPLYGVQFHPEKSGEPGVRLLVNLLKKC